MLLPRTSRHGRAWSYLLHLTNLFLVIRKANHWSFPLEVKSAPESNEYWVDLGALEHARALLSSLDANGLPPGSQAIVDGSWPRRETPQNVPFFKCTMAINVLECPFETSMIIVCNLSLRSKHYCYK